LGAIIHIFEKELCASIIAVLNFITLLLGRWDNKHCW